MTKLVNISIDGKEAVANEGQGLVEAAKDNGSYIPTLCYKGEKEKCLGTCRVCTVRVNGRYSAACTLKVQEGMMIQISSPELFDIRKSLIEMLFVEGNHFCPGCEKSGDCQLQALGYHHQMTIPRFPYRYNYRPVSYDAKNILFEHNRCVMCKRCTDMFQDDQGRKVFSFIGKGSCLQVSMNLEYANELSDAKIDEAASLCPVGAILKKGKGFDRPIGERKFDKNPVSGRLHD